MSGADEKAPDPPEEKGKGFLSHFRTKELVQNTIALIVTCSYSWQFIQNKVTPKDYKEVVIMVFGFYFIAKAALAKPDKE